MANRFSNTTGLSGMGGTNGGASFAVRKVNLINPNETLVKKEEKSIIVRNLDGKLVRRTAPSGSLSDVYDLIHEGEVFVREEETRLVIRNLEGKLVAREIIIEEILEEEPSIDLEPTQTNSVEPEIEAEPELEEVAEIEPVVETTQVQDKPQVSEPEPASESSSLRDRLKSRHAFLDRMDKGQKIGVAPVLDKEETFKVVNADLVEEIEDEEEILPDASVRQLENDVSSDTIMRANGYTSGKGLRAGERSTYVSGGAINPNEKPNLGGSGVSKGLVGNYALPTPEKEVVIPQEKEKKKKEKKHREPVKPWVVVVALVSIYLVGMLSYFFVGYNFNNKAVAVVLYYIDIGENAKLEYYDGEQFNYNAMKMTYYYSDDNIKSFNITSDNFADTTIGMGYSINNEYISALWIDSFASASSRVVKVKFTFDNLICYVPITIYRNKLDQLEKLFYLSSINAGQEITPTIFGTYTNHLLEERGETIRKVIPLEDYDLQFNYDGKVYWLKEIGYFDGEKYILPETLDHDDDPQTDEVVVDYSASISIRARVPGDNITTDKYLTIYSQ